MSILISLHYCGTSFYRVSAAQILLKPLPAFGHLSIINHRLTGIKKTRNIPAYVLYDKRPFFVFKLLSVGILEKQSRELRSKNNPGCHREKFSQDFLYAHRNIFTRWRWWREIFQLGGRLQRMSRRWQTSWCKTAKDLIKPPTDTHTRFLLIYARNSLCFHPRQKINKSHLNSYIPPSNKSNTSTSRREPWRKVLLLSGVGKRPPTASIQTIVPTTSCPKHEQRSRAVASAEHRVSLQIT